MGKTARFVFQIANYDEVIQSMVRLARERKALDETRR